MPASEQIVLIGGYLFPEGDGAAIRTLSLARMCRDLGYEVVVVGKGQLRPADYETQRGGFFIDGIRYTTMNPRRLLMTERLLHPLSRIRLYRDTIDSLGLPTIKAIVINACDSAMHVPLMINYCRDRSIRLIGDICEWYDPCQIPYGRLNPSYAIFHVVFHHYFPRLRNMVVVSRLLERRFASPGRRLLRVAAPMDVQAIPCQDLSPHDRMVLVYAGSPGKKDLLREFVAAIATLSETERTRLEMRLIGLTEQQLRALLGDDEHLMGVLHPVVKPLGRVSRDQVLRHLQEAHFSVLLRPDKRYAHAGFPSKVAESLSTGTPLMLNFTSDLRDYLADGTAAIEIRDCSVAGVAQAIRTALALPPEELRAMRQSARAKAEIHFDYRPQTSAFGKFLAEAC